MNVTLRFRPALLVPTTFSILKDEYLAGLWRRYLAQHLLWTVETPQTAGWPTTDSKSYCAPSLVLGVSC
jgi:hypothetical protein